MHIQVVNFNLEGITHDDYMKIADDMAPVFAEVEGLKSKVWLEDQENNTYGGVYTWESKQAYDNYVESDLFKGVGSNPSFVNISSKDFGILDDPSKVCGM